MSHVTIDLNRGINKEVGGHPIGPSSSPSPFGFLRRKKGLVLILCLSLSLLLFVNRSYLSSAEQSSIRWVKDSMRPPTDSNKAQNAPSPSPLPNDFGANIAQGALAENHKVKAGTDAFRKLAEEQGYTSEEIDVLVAGEASGIKGSQPTGQEQILLFFEALANPNYAVPSWSYSWKSQLMPSSEKSFAKSIKQVLPQGGNEDAALFKTDRSQWSALHRAQNPLTVFSKSYCPYSRRAKELLRSMGAKMNVIEVDLRPHDAESLQAALAALSGHHTFPAVFAGDKLLGGFDDIDKLHQLKILSGMLKGSGAL
ncbi:unnamed protein product [Sympodiomycopsis kandeliae]